MKKMLDTIQGNLDSVYTVGLELFEKYNVEYISEDANGESETLDEFREYWHNNFDKLQAIYKAWSIHGNQINIQKFNMLCVTADETISLKLNELRLVREHCLDISDADAAASVVSRLPS